MTKLEVIWRLAGEDREWSWTDKPNAHDLRDHGGCVVIRPLPFGRFPIEFRVVGPSEDLEPWLVLELRIVGTRGAVESYCPVDTFSRFSDALGAAKELCHAAIAKAGGRQP